MGFCRQRNIVFVGKNLPYVMKPTQNQSFRWEKHTVLSCKGPQLFSVLFTIKFVISPLSFFQLFLISLLVFSIFPHFPLHFPFFYLFSLPQFSPFVTKNLPVQSLWGALCPLPPPVTPLLAGA